MQYHNKTVYTWMLRFFPNVSHCYQLVGLMQTRSEVGPRTCSPQCSYPSSSETGKGRGKLSRKTKLKAQRSILRPLNEMYLSLLYWHLPHLFNYSRDSRSLARKPSPKDTHLLSCGDVALLQLSPSHF